MSTYQLNRGYFSIEVSQLRTPEIWIPRPQLQLCIQYMCTYIQIHVYTCKSNTFVHTQCIYMYMYMYTCIYIYTCTCIHVYTCMYSVVSIHLHVYIYMYMYIVYYTLYVYSTCICLLGNCDTIYTCLYMYMTCGLSKQFLL